MTGGLEATEPEGLPPALALRAVMPPAPGVPTALLLTDEDCTPEHFDLSALDLRAVATLQAGHRRSPRPVAPAVLRFEEAALADVTTRTGLVADPLTALHPDVITKWAAQAGVAQVVTPYVTRGPLYDWLAEARPLLAARGIALCEWRRDWDSAIWPHATAGFFKVKQRIPQFLDQLGVSWTAG